MKAVIWQGGDNFAYGDYPEPKIGSEQVLVQVQASSVCTTDFHYGDFDCKPPLVPGHEVAGEVVELGSEVTSLRIGDRVTLDPVQRCWKCRMCQMGLSHLCLDVRHLGGERAPGGWAEYVAVDAQNAYLIPDGVDYESASLCEPIAVCLESFKRANFQAGQRVLIMGDGVFGYIHACIAKILGAETIVMAGHYDERLTRAQNKTQVLICNTHNQNLAEMVDKELGDKPFDFAIEATGAGPAPNMALPLLRPRGKMVLFSCVWKPEPLDMETIHMNELDILGSCRSLDCFDTCLQWMADGKIVPREMIDILVKLEDFAEARDRLAKDKRNVFKAVLLP